MRPIPVSLLTICGLSELQSHRTRGVTHVLSILDPEWPEPEPFRAYDPHHRTTLNFHDVIEPGPGLILPRREHVERIVAFGEDLKDSAVEGRDPHLLVHCHMGISLHGGNGHPARPGSPARGRGCDLCPHHRDPSPGLAELAHDRLRR